MKQLIFSLAIVLATFIQSFAVAPITGTANVCQGLTEPLSDATLSGTWSSSDATIATVAATTGVVTGVLAGTVTITYMVGTAYAITSFTVNPMPSVTIPPGQTVCAGELTAAVTFTGTAETYAWANSNTAIGLPASGSGNIAPFTATNSTSAPIDGMITVTPMAAGCPPGTAQTFTITVNPTPSVTAPASQTICNSATSAAVIFTGTVSGETYNWTNSNSLIGLGPDGAGDIPSFTGTNSSTAPVTAEISVTPLAYGCDGPSQSFTITVNPSPAPISGLGWVCISFPTTPLTDATAGGTWSSGNTSIATVDAAGNVTGVGVGTVTVTYALGTGCFSSFNMWSDVCEGIQTVSNGLNGFTFYPNPATNVLTIQAAPATYNAYSLTNETGQLITTGSITTSQTNVNVGTLPPGLYFISLRGGGGRTVQKFLKE